MLRIHSNNNDMCAVVLFQLKICCCWGHPLWVRVRVCAVCGEIHLNRNWRTFFWNEICFVSFSAAKSKRFDQWSSSLIAASNMYASDPMTIARYSSVDTFACANRIKYTIRTIWWKTSSSCSAYTTPETSSARRRRFSESQYVVDILCVRASRHIKGQREISARTQCFEFYYLSKHFAGGHENSFIKRSTLNPPRNNALSWLMAPDSVPGTYLTTLC